MFISPRQCANAMARRMEEQPIFFETASPGTCHFAVDYLLGMSLLVKTEACVFFGSSLDTSSTQHKSREQPDRQHDNSRHCEYGCCTAVRTTVRQDAMRNSTRAQNVAARRTINRAVKMLQKLLCSSVPSDFAPQSDTIKTSPYVERFRHRCTPAHMTILVSP